MFSCIFENFHLTLERLSFILCSGGVHMDISTKIKLAETYAKMSEAELARKMGTTSQAFGQRIKTGKFSSSDLDAIASALGAKFVCYFKFPDGTEI